MAQMVKNLPAMQENRVQSLGPKKIPWGREWLPTVVFLPRESNGQRSLVGYSPWGRKESDMTKRLTLSLSRINICICLFSLFQILFPYMLLYSYNNIYYNTYTL